MNGIKKDVMVKAAAALIFIVIGIMQIAVRSETFAGIVSIAAGAAFALSIFTMKKK